MTDPPYEVGTEGYIYHRDADKVVPVKLILVENSLNKYYTADVTGDHNLKRSQSRFLIFFDEDLNYHHPNHIRNFCLTKKEAIEKALEYMRGYSRRTLERHTEDHVEIAETFQMLHKQLREVYEQ